MQSLYEFLWLFILPAILFSYYHIIRHAGRFIPPMEERPEDPRCKIVFQIAARRLMPLVQESVDHIHSACRQVGFSNYEVKLVVDSIGAEVKEADIVLVPDEFKCLSKYKARSLHYAIRFLPNDKNVWILHLDEDAWVTPQCVSRLLSYIEKGGQPVANGPTIYPYDGSVWTFYAEAQRHWTFYWLQDQLLTSTVHWLNGSNLLIRSDVEHAVGWDFVNCNISEDSRFGYEATKKLGRVFGWHGGLTIEKPPATVRGLIKQRTRWFWGSILNLRYVPRGRLPRRVYSIAVWLNAFVLTIFFFVLLLGLAPRPWFFRTLAIGGVTATSIFWIARYEVGIHYNLKESSVSKWGKVALYLGIIPLIPVIDFLCTVPTVVGLLQRPGAFQITDKK